MKISKELQRWIFEKKTRVYRPPGEAPPQPPLPKVLQFETKTNRFNPIMMTNFRNSSIFSVQRKGIIQLFSRYISTATFLRISDSKCKTITELCTKKEPICKTKKVCQQTKITCQEDEKQEKKCKTDCLPKLRYSDNRKLVTPEKQEYPPMKCNPSKIGGLSPCPCKFIPKEICHQEIPVKKTCPPPLPLPKSPSKPIVLCPCPPPPKLPPTSCPCVPEVVNEICENENPPKPCPTKPKKPCANQSYYCSSDQNAKCRKSK